MAELMMTLNQPGVLGTLFIASVVLLLLDYLLPIDWLAYLGYVSFAVFIGATAPASPFNSVVVMVVVLAVALLLHEFFFAQYLTNAPRHESRPTDDVDEQDTPNTPDAPESPKPTADES